MVRHSLVSGKVTINIPEQCNTITVTLSEPANHIQLLKTVCCMYVRLSCEIEYVEPVGHCIAVCQATLTSVLWPKKR